MNDYFAELGRTLDRRWRAAHRDEGTDAAIAWAYVGFRVVHSVFQATVNKIEVRFALFFLSSLVLAAMTARAALAVWS